VITTRRPAKVWSGEPAASMAASTRSSAARRPTPLRPEASAPLSGSTTDAPRARSVATLCWVAALSHMPLSIAGASTSGARVDSTMAESTSSASPCASRASVLAEAGATTTTSTSCARSTCSISCPCSDHRSVRTARCVSASKVRGVTKRWALSVSATCTVWPACVSERTSSMAL
jgi:hypothetical protein